jgi:hypothetical protein
MLLNISNKIGHLSRTGHFDESRLNIVNRDTDDLLVESDSIESVQSIVGDTYAVSLVNEGVWVGISDLTFIWNNTEVTKQEFINHLGKDKILKSIFELGWDHEDDISLDDFIEKNLNDYLRQLGYIAIEEIEPLKFNIYLVI